MLLHRVFTFIQYVSTTLLCTSSKVTPNLNHSNAAKRKMSYNFAREMTRFDYEMEQEEEEDQTQSEAGSQISLKEDDVIQYRYNSKRIFVNRFHV